MSGFMGWLQGLGGGGGAVTTGGPFPATAQADAIDPTAGAPGWDLAAPTPSDPTSYASTGAGPGAVDSGTWSNTGPAGGFDASKVPGALKAAAGAVPAAAAPKFLQAQPATVSRGNPGQLNALAQQLLQRRNLLRQAQTQGTAPAMPQPLGLLGF